MDFQLMFLQTPMDKMRNWKRFKNKTSSKILVIFFTVVSIVIMFLPTLLAFATEIMGKKVYYYSNINIHSQEEFASDPFSNPDPLVLPTLVEDYPPFDDFRIVTWRDMFNRAEYEFRRWITTESIVKNYLHTHLDLPFNTNKAGVWYGVLKNLTSIEYLDRSDNDYYNYNTYHEYQEQHEAPTMQKMDTTTGTYRTDDDTPTYTFGLTGQNSFSLHECDGQLTSNLPDFENHQLLAVSNATAGVLCYPQFDASLPITVQVGSTRKKSVLDENDRVFRTARLNNVPDSFSTISVSAMSLNDTFITMAIKKSAHITFHGDTIYWDDENELPNCSPANLDEIYTDEPNEAYNHLNHTRILCQLKAFSQQNPGFNMLQATRRFLSANFSVNSVYTYAAPTTDNPLGGVAIDLTWFTSYTLESPVFNFPKDQEFLIAHAFNDKDRGSYQNIETLIRSIDVFDVTNPRNAVLPNLVKIQAALNAKSTYYISKTTASVHLAYDITSDPSWIYMVAVPGCVFFLLACLRQKKRTLRARISACSTVEQFDDRATLVAGRTNNNTTALQPSTSKPTKLSFCYESVSTQATSITPVLMVDRKSIILQQ
ncbi:unnamed protein product [Mucor fragilis]